MCDQFCTADVTWAPLNMDTRSAIDGSCGSVAWLGATQQTRDIHPLLVQFWASVVDGGPTLNQQWVNVSYLLGRHRKLCRDNQLVRRTEISAQFPGVMHVAVYLSRESQDGCSTLARHCPTLAEHWASVSCSPGGPYTWYITQVTFETVFYMVLVPSHIL